MKIFSAGFFLFIILAGCNLFALNKDSLSVDASKAFREKDYSLAISKYESVLEKKPNDVVALKYSALSYMRLNLPIKAIQYLERAKKIEPRNSSIRYYLAQCYLVAGESEKAKNEIAYIKNNLPDDIYAHKAKNLEPKTLKKGKKYPLKLYFRNGFQYDSNVSLQPDKLKGLNENEDSARYVTYSWLEYTAFNQKPYSGGVIGSFYQSMHTESELQRFNLSSFDFGPFFTFDVNIKGRNFQNRVEYRFLFDVLNGESFCRTSQVHYRVATAITNWLDGAIYTQTNFSDFFYRDSLRNEKFLNRDAVNTESGIRLTVKLPRNMYVYTGYDYTNNDAEGTNWNYSRNRIFAEFATPVFTEKLYFYFLNEYYNRYFDPYEGSLYSTTAERNENYYSFRPKLRYFINRSASLETSYRYIKNEANIERFFEYHRNIFDVTFVYQY